MATTGWYQDRGVWRNPLLQPRRPATAPAQAEGPDYMGFMNQLQGLLNPTKDAEAPAEIPGAQLLGRGLVKGGTAVGKAITGGSAVGGAVGAAAAVGLPLIGAGLLLHGDMMKRKRAAQRERRNIRTRFSIERGRETQAITESTLGTARRMGSDVAAVASANGMGGSGAALNSVMQNRAQILAGIPEQVRAARAAIAAREEAALAETGDGTELVSGITRMLSPFAGDFFKGVFKK